MRLYTYEAQNQQGQTIAGTLQAESEDAAVAQLQAHGYWVSSLTSTAAEAPTPARPGLWETLFPPVRKKDLAVSFRQLATMTGAGMTLLNTLDQLERNTSNARLKQVFREVFQRVQQGGRLSDALAEHPAVFPEIVIGIVSAAETSGKLDTMLKTLAQYLEDQWELDQLIRRETLYPKILLAAIIVLPLIGLFFISTLGLASMSSFSLVVSLITVLGVGGAALLVAGFLLARVYRQTRTGNRALDALKMRIPLLGKITSRFAIARLSKALAAMYESGLTLPQSVNLAGRASGNAVIAEAMERLSDDLRQGRVRSVSEGFAQSGLFPSMVVEMVSTGEQTGNLDEMLNKVTEYFEDEAKTASKQLAYTAMPIAVLIAGAVVLVVAALFFTGIYAPLG